MRGDNVASKAAADQRPRFGARAGDEILLERFVTASSLLGPSDLITRCGDYVRIWRLGGIAAEAADPQHVAAWHNAKIALYRNLAGGQFGVYEYRHQYYASDVLSPVEDGTYAAEFDRQYRERIAQRPWLMKDLYLAIIHRPGANAAADQNKSRRTRKREEIIQEQIEALTVMRNLTSMVERLLYDFDPQLLGIRKEGAREFSEVLEFWALLVNGRRIKCGVLPGKLWTQLAQDRLSFNYDKIEFRALDAVRYACGLEIKEYDENVEPGTLSPLLYENIEYLEVQTFFPTPRREALKWLKDQHGFLASSEDAAVSQVDALARATDEVAGGAYEYGNYYYALFVFGATPAEAARNAARARGAITENSSMTMVETREVGDAAWFCLQPGSFGLRPREAHISSRAFAALSCSHNFARGKRDGNPWGEALGVFRTPSGQPFYLSLHLSSDDEDDEGKKLPGNTLLFGSTGAGKTTLELALMMWNRKYPRVRQLIFDLDRGCEIAIRACRGKYFALRVGEPTGCNPFQRYPDAIPPGYLVFLEQFTSQLLLQLTPNLPLMPADHAAISSAVQAIARAPYEQRKLSLLQQMLPKDSQNSLYHRLAPWCCDGQLGWCFDRAPDRIGNIAAESLIGFDYTEFLGNDQARTPMMMYLMACLQECVTGEPFVYYISEAWRALQDPVFSNFVNTQQKTIRKKDGIGIFDTQSPSDMLKHANGRTMVEQTVTKICLPNQAAQRDEYVGGFGLTAAEFEIVRALGQSGARQFLVKQGHRSAVCEFDLGGMDDVLTVLSGSTDNIVLLDELRAQVGDDPKLWLPLMNLRVRARKGQRR